MKLRTMALLLGAMTLSTAFNPAFAADDPAAAADPAAPVVKKKVKKDAEYMQWEKASAASTACDQPILAYIEMKGDKAGSKIRMKTIGNAVFKDFVKDNFIYYHYSVPQEEVRQGRGQQRQKNPVIKPDFKAVKASESAAISKLCPGASPSFPVIAVVAPGGGRVVGTVFLSPEDASFSKFVEELKPLVESAKCEFTVSKKIQKVLDDEAKKRAALEKQKK